MSNVTVSKFEGQWQVKVDGRVVGKLDSQTAQAVEHQLLRNRLNAEGVPAGHMRIPAGSAALGGREITPVPSTRKPIAKKAKSK